MREVSAILRRLTKAMSPHGLGGAVLVLAILSLVGLTVAFIAEAVIRPAGSGQIYATALSPGSYDHCNSEGFSVLGYDKILRSPYQFQIPGASIDWQHVSRVAQEIPRPIWFEGSLNTSSQTCPGERGQILQTAVGHNARTGEYLEVIGIIVPPQKPFPYSLVDAFGG